MLRWRRSAAVLPENALTSPVDDWSLVDETGRVLARLYDSHYPEIEGTWRWRVYVDAQGREKPLGGACATGTEARQMCESRIPDWLGGKMKTRR